MKEYKYIEELPARIDHFSSDEILPPWSMDMEVTSRCNLRCFMCPKKLGLEPNPSDTDMSSETFKKVEKAFPELNRMNLNGFGESFLHPDFIDMIEVIGKYDIFANITTNGLVIKKEKMKDLVRSGISNVSFSIDSIDPETYKLIRGVNKVDKVLDNLKLLLKTKEELGTRLPYVGMSFVAMSVNIEQLPDIVEFARKHCLNTISICPFDDYQDRYGYSMTNCIEKARESFIKARNIAIQHNMNV
ncbi:radical SAM protein, partial [bacterium]|nr:radical SAM protein [bacterium]